MNSSPHVPEGLRVTRATALHSFRLVVLSSAVFLVLSGVPYQLPSVEQVALFAALFTIGLLDIGLSHGDTADVDTALLVAGVYLYGAPAILLLCTVARVSVHAIASRDQGLLSLVDALVKRHAAVVASIPLLSLLELLGTGGMIEQFVNVVLLGLGFSVVQLVVGQLGRARARGDSMVRLLAGNLALQGPLVAASISLAVLIVVTIEDMGPWAIVLTLILLLTMRQSFVLLLDIRSAYQSTIEALVGAMEAQQAESGRGVGEEVAALARMLGAELGWFGARLERIGMLRYFTTLAFR